MNVHDRYAPPSGVAKTVLIGGSAKTGEWLIFSPTHSLLERVSASITQILVFR